MKKYSSLLIYIIIFLYYELNFRLVSSHDILNTSTIYIVTYIIFLSAVMYFISLFFSNKINKIIMYIVLTFNFLFFSMQYVLNEVFRQYFSFSLFGTSGQILDFKEDAATFIINNISVIFIFLLPIILISVCLSKIELNPSNRKQRLISALIVILTIIGFNLSLLIDSDDIYSGYNLYYKYHNNSLAVEKLGVINSFHLDSIKAATNFTEEIIIINHDINKLEEDDENKEEEEVIYEYNNLDINFDNITGNSNIDILSSYFENDKGTLQNEYTGYFEGKNLILIMAESYHEIALDKKRTPTLYKLVNEGFNFTNFYTPTIYSTIGGEFQMLSGLYPASGFLDAFKAGENTYPFGISTVFKNLDYETYAYHNNDYTFQNRDKYLSAYGFDNYLGCYNGLEKEMDCDWLQSDVELIDVTADDYLKSEESFMVFYASVSGHGDYSVYNEFSKKYLSEVTGNYSDDVKAYLAAQIELDRALELLIEKLEVAGELENTVIALAGDHYPYMLSFDEINEASDYYRDEIIEMNHSNLVIWNNKMESVTIDKVGSQIDIIPTLYNLFGIEYDSRLFAGKDILSTEAGLAIFSNRSWVSDYGSYDSSSGVFTPKEGKSVSDDYVDTMNQIVLSKINVSGLLMTEDYYKYINVNGG